MVHYSIISGLLFALFATKLKHHLRLVIRFDVAITGHHHLCHLCHQLLKWIFNFNKILCRCSQIRSRCDEQKRNERERKVKRFVQSHIKLPAVCSSSSANTLKTFVSSARLSAAKNVDYQIASFAAAAANFSSFSLVLVRSELELPKHTVLIGIRMLVARALEPKNLYCNFECTLYVLLLLFGRCLRYDLLLLWFWWSDLNIHLKQQQQRSKRYRLSKSGVVESWCDRYSAHTKFPAAVLESSVMPLPLLLIIRLPIHIILSIVSTVVGNKSHVVLCRHSTVAVTNWISV